jgi:integrase
MGSSMSVRKRSWTTRLGDQKEAWIVDYTDGQGHRHIRTFERKKDADAFHATAKVDVRAGVHTSSKATVAKTGEAWLASCEANKLERSTVESYRQHLQAHILPYLGATKLSELTVPTVRNFMDKLRADGRSTAMVKRVIGDLGSILADAQERGLVAQNVVRSLRAGRRRGQTRKEERRQRGKLKVGTDIPAPPEIRAIIGKLEGRWRPLILTAIFTGLRASELRGLRWDDVDLKHGELHVRQRADRFNKIGKPKSEAGERVVPLPSFLVNALREWKLAAPGSDLGLVFPNGAGHVENHSNIIHRALMPVQIAAGVVSKDGAAKYSGLHSLRHFYASWCINRKADGGLELPPKVVQERLGHASIVMTMDRYGHLFARGDDTSELSEATRLLVG